MVIFAVSDLVNLSKLLVTNVSMLLKLIKVLVLKSVRSFVLSLEQISDIEIITEFRKQRKKCDNQSSFMSRHTSIYNPRFHLTQLRYFSLFLKGSTLTIKKTFQVQQS